MNEQYLLAHAIIHHIAQKLNFDAQAIRSGRQMGTLGKVRCIAIHEIRENTALKNSEIAALFGCRSHCMVSNRLSVYRHLIFSSHAFKKSARLAKFKID